VPEERPPIRELRQRHERGGPLIRDDERDRARDREREKERERERQKGRERPGPRVMRAGVMRGASAFSTRSPTLIFQKRHR